MNILNALKQLRDDIKAWATVNLNALNTKIDEKTFPIDSKLDDTSTNPVQNQAIAKEIDSINDRVGDTPVATQISQAINTQEHFSGDYNDLTNAPDITDDGSDNMVITDEAGNIIFKADADGIHTTAVSINGEAAATEKYVDDAVANIDIPEVDFTGYATEKYVDDAIAEIPTPDVSGQINVHNTSETAHEDIRESINNVSELVGTTAVSKQIEDAIAEIPKTDLSNYYNKEETDTAINTAKEELSESIVAESDEWKVVDEAGNVIFSVDATGAHTTELTLNGENAATESYVDDAIANIEFPTTDLTDYATKKYVDDAVNGVDFTGYATETYVDNKVADLVNAAPEALDTLGELAVALEVHEDAYDALLETVGGKATHTDLENLKEELSESIVAETDEWKVVDNDGNIIFSVDAEGAHTTNLTLNGEATATEAYVDEAIGDIQFPETDFTGYATEQYVDDAIAAIPKTDLTDYATKKYVDDAVAAIDIPEINLSDYYTKEQTDAAINTAKEELSESIVAESDEWKVVDEAGNIIFSVDASGAHTTTLTLNGESVEDILEQKFADLVDSAPETLNTLNELANALGDDPNFATTVLNQIANKEAFVNVASLPTINISDKIAYRVLEGTFVGQKRFRYDATCHVVDWVNGPTGAGENALRIDGSDLSYVGYYNIVDNQAYAYIDKAVLRSDINNSTLDSTTKAQLNLAISLIASGWQTFEAFISSVGSIVKASWGGIAYTLEDIINESALYLFIGAKTYYRNNGVWTSGDFTIGRRGTDSDAEVFNDLNNIASAPYAHAEGSLVTASGAYSHAEGYRTEAGGLGAHAEGQDTHATGNNAHTEGQGSRAEGIRSHAEGFNTFAIGEASHTEGYKTFTGFKGYSEVYFADFNNDPDNAQLVIESTEPAKYYSIGDNLQIGLVDGSILKDKFKINNIYEVDFGSDEPGGTQMTLSKLTDEDITIETADIKYIGVYNKPCGDIAIGGAYAHAEGYNTLAIGENAHAEGKDTVASGDYSHAGGLGTIASEEAQTVIGKYNQEDSNALFIVGNGTSEATSDRKNAFTVNKDGSATLAKVGENDNNIATVGYLNDQLNALITVADIDTICGGNIVAASEVTF